LKQRERDDWQVWFHTFSESRPNLDAETNLQSVHQNNGSLIIN